MRQGQVPPLSSPSHQRHWVFARGVTLAGGVTLSILFLRTELLGCYSDQDFLAKLHCVRQAFEVDMVQEPLGEGAGPAPYGATLCPAMTALSTGSGRLPLSPFFLQGLLEERNNQVFFGEVGRQMVTGLMTKAEKVAGVGLLFQISLQNLISGWVFVLFC